MEPSGISGTRFRTAFVLILALAVSLLFLAVIWPFFKSLLLGALLAGLCHPLYRWMAKLFRGRNTAAAIVTLLLLFLLVAVPFSAFLGVVLRQALTITDQAIPWVQQHFGSATAFNAHDWLVQRFPALHNHIPSQEQIADGIGTVAKSAGAFLVAVASKMTAGTAAVILNFFVMIYAMFFFFRDGDKILHKIFYYLPLTDSDEDQMLHRFVSITRATLKGTLMIGIIQGALAGFAFKVAGLDGAAFWGTMMAILSVVPGVGPALVWVPAVIYLFVSGQTLAAILLLLWCSAAVGTIDNILRPILVGKDAKMPDMLILLGTLGGLYLFGPIGFIAGPIVCGLFLTIWDIYGATFKDILPPVRRGAYEKI